MKSKKLSVDTLPIDELKIGEIHPSARLAITWFRAWQAEKGAIGYVQTREAIASTALSGNRMAQVCHGTLERLENGQPISDRYLLGLCWFLKEMDEDE